MNRDAVIKRLKDIVGPDRVLTSQTDLEPYSADMTEAEPHMPDAAVFPLSTQEIVQIVKMANEEKCPLISSVARTNLGGLTIPERGGLILDLTRMRKIHAVNTDEMYIMIEPGTTFQDVKDYLETHHPDLRFSYPLSPPWTGVIANTLLNGLANLSFRGGTMDQWINCMEVVLPTGEIMKTGSAVLTDIWWGKGPIPDLGALFYGWQGTTGIVTKMAVEVYPKLPYNERAFILCYRLEDGFDLMRTLSRTLLFDDIGGLSWPTGKMLFGLRENLVKASDEPEFFVYIDYAANTKGELSAKKKVLNGVLKKAAKRGVEFENPLDVPTLVRVNPAFEKFASFPTTLDFLLETEAGGLTWVGTYGPTAHWSEVSRKCHAIQEEAGFPPVLVSRPMKLGHYGVARFIQIFRKNDPEHRKLVRQVNEKIFETALDLGYIPYKAPVWGWDKFLKRIDPIYRQKMEQIKKMLDPNGIMNPGKMRL